MPDDLRRLHPSGPISRGLSVDTDGAMLGPDCVLVRRGPNGYLTADRAEAATIQQLVFGGDRRPDWLFDHCCRIAKALNDGQIALAQIYGVHSAPNDLDHKRQAKLAKAAILIKANFNPDQPRVPAGNPDGGQWMTAGEVSSDHLKPRPAADGAWSGYIDAAWNGDYHQYLVQYFADITRAAGGAAVTEVPLVAIDGTRARADLIVRPKEASEPFAIEIKTGTDWQLKLNQQRIYEMLPLGGHVTANKEGLEKLGLVSGRPLPPMRNCLWLRWGQAGTSDTAGGHPNRQAAVPRSLQRERTMASSDGTKWHVDVTEFLKGGVLGSADVARRFAELVLEYTQDREMLEQQRPLIVEDRGDVWLIHGSWNRDKTQQGFGAFQMTVKKRDAQVLDLGMPVVFPSPLQDKGKSG